jgi:hypothetical protein
MPSNLVSRGSPASERFVIRHHQVLSEIVTETPLSRASHALLDHLLRT